MFAGRDITVINKPNSSFIELVKYPPGWSTIIPGGLKPVLSRTCKNTNEKQV